MVEALTCNCFVVYVGEVVPCFCILHVSVEVMSVNGCFMLRFGISNGKIGNYWDESVGMQ